MDIWEKDEEYFFGKLMICYWWLWSMWSHEKSRSSGCFIQIKICAFDKTELSIFFGQAVKQRGGGCVYFATKPDVVVIGDYDKCCRIQMMRSQAVGAQSKQRSVLLTEEKSSPSLLVKERGVVACTLLWNLMLLLKVTMLLYPTDEKSRSGGWIIQTKICTFDKRHSSLS